MITWVVLHVVMSIHEVSQDEHVFSLNMVRAKGRHKGGGLRTTQFFYLLLSNFVLPSHPIFVWEDDLLDYFDYYFFR